ncbi:hypothetical protein NDU88_004999 [Pleurodeles waltl]|uniref:Uncharacterized protein n=1 Tax=Pleurodeles waltl TaxID=8319 RepID=A0AAV7PGI4_PLEWA|nr:hypothetical protein NDU88_004999 [Pleurodeles waltl]
MRETVLAEVAQRSPTSPETNLESRAMQVRVPWTQAWLCTKDFRRKCTGAGVACKVAVPSNAAQRGTTRARDFPFGGWIPHALESCAEVFSRRMDANKPCYAQIVRLAFLDAARAQEGPGGRKLDLKREETSSKTKRPHLSR